MSVSLEHITAVLNLRATIPKDRELHLGKGISDEIRESSQIQFDRPTRKVLSYGVSMTVSTTSQWIPRRCPVTCRAGYFFSSIFKSLPWCKGWGEGGVESGLNP